MIKKPVVLTNGELEQLQAGDSITVNSLISQLTNDEASPITLGMVVYASDNGKVKKAQADAATTSKVIGVVADASIAASDPGNIITEGEISASTATWDALTGDSGGLTYGAPYFLSPTTAGSITKTPPTTGGTYAVQLGYALSDTTLKFHVQLRVLI